MAHHSHDHDNEHNATFASFSPPECIAWLSVFGMEAIVMVTLNALIIIVYLKERSLRQRNMYLVINQAVADMFVGGCGILESWFLASYCEIWTVNSLNATSLIEVNVWFHFIPTASVTSLASISLERMHATFRPFQHRVIKKKMFGATITAVWTTTGLFLAIIFATIYHPLSIEVFHDFLLAYVSLLLLCLLVIVVSYSSITAKFACGNQPRHHVATDREKKLTKTLLIVTVVSLLLTLPYIVFWILHIMLWHTIPIIYFPELLRLKYSFGILFYANSLINPVLYAFRMPEFRRTLFSFFCCRSPPQQAQVFPLNET
ncbi:melanocortin receptor 5-like [Acropora palmata]|uniref:melanocortin receptor 5-like n=1 Tax=Acropora palmata TaxID=6131 RepID=UPI003DA0C6DA